MSREDERITTPRSGTLAAERTDADRPTLPEPDEVDVVAVVQEEIADAAVPVADAVEQQLALGEVGTDDDPGWEVDPADAADRSVTMDEDEYR
ncbi:MAG: hypothetical protein R2737_02525 [Candidatus Nanopelagicales bacterium]